MNNRERDLLADLIVRMNNRASVERDTLRAQLEEIRARKEVDATLDASILTGRLMGQREEIARLRTERDGLLNQVAGHDEDIRRLHNERDRLGRTYQTEAAELKTQLDQLASWAAKNQAARDRLETELAESRDKLRAALARGDFAHMDLAQLKVPAEPAKIERPHPVAVGEWVMAGCGTPGRILEVVAEERFYRVKTESPIPQYWGWGSCEPCDPPEASHDTPEGKAAAESVIRESRNTGEPEPGAEPVEDAIKVGDVVRVTGHALCLEKSLGCIGLVESTGVGPLGPWIKMCFAVEDVTKVESSVTGVRTDATTEESSAVAPIGVGDVVRAKWWKTGQMATVNDILSDGRLMLDCSDQPWRVSEVEKLHQKVAP